MADPVLRRRLVRAAFAFGAAVAVFAVVFPGSGGDAVSAEAVERALRREARREHEPLAHIECVRSEELPRSFSCFAEGPDDLHVAYRVLLRHDGTLDIQLP